MRKSPLVHRTEWHGPLHLTQSSHSTLDGNYSITRSYKIKISVIFNNQMAVSEPYSPLWWHPQRAGVYLSINTSPVSVGSAHLLIFAPQTIRDVPTSDCSGRQIDTSPSLISGRGNLVVRWVWFV